MTEQNILSGQALVDGNNHLTETTIDTTAFALIVEITTLSALGLTPGQMRPKVWLFAVSSYDIGTFDETVLDEIRPMADAIKCEVSEAALVRRSKLQLTPAEGTRLYTWIECENVVTGTLQVDLDMAYI